MTCLQNKDIRTETEQFMGQRSSSPVRHDAPVKQQPRSRRQRRDSSQIQRTARQNIPNARHDLGTPPNSTGSVTSYTSSAATAGVERIYLMFSDNDVEDRPVMSRSVPGKHNLIGDSLAFSDGFVARKFPVDESVFVPLSSGGQRREKVTVGVTVSWHRYKELKTKSGTFYVVSSNLLDCDVILGFEGSHHFPSGQSTTISQNLRPFRLTWLLRQKAFQKHSQRKYPVNKRSWISQSMTQQFLRPRQQRQNILTEEPVCRLTFIGNTAM